MNPISMKRRAFSDAMVAVCIGVWLYGSTAGLTQPLSATDSQHFVAPWESSARLHHFAGKDKGDLSINADGIEFRPQKAASIKIPYLEVQTFQLAPHSLSIETYENRRMRLGVVQYRFDLDRAIPPSVGAELARQVRKPSQNAVPDPESQALTVAAHHRTATGGTNGVLRFHEGGIDYVSTASGDSRSWRWADLQTLSAPDPHHLLVFGYRDTYTFDLKEILPQSQYYRSVDAIDVQNGAALGRESGAQPRKSSEGYGPGAANE